MLTMIMTDLLPNVAIVICYISLFYVIISAFLSLIQFAGASRTLKKYFKTKNYLQDKNFVSGNDIIPISILIPVRNKMDELVAAMDDIMNFDFPEYEVIVINDGGTTDSLQLLIDKFHLIKFNKPFKKSIATEPHNAIYRSLKYENLTVIDKKYGGRADALNTGINFSSYPVFISLEPGCKLSKDSLKTIIVPFISDPTCLALAGAPLMRISMSTIKRLLVLSNGFYAFNKNMTIQVGGFKKNCAGVETELIINLHRHMRKIRKPYSIKFLPDSIYEPPHVMPVFGVLRQQKKQHISLMNSLLVHRKMLFNFKYGKIGLLSIPYYWIFKMLGPLFESLGYIFIVLSWAMGLISAEFAITFFILSILYGIIISMSALLLEAKLEDTLASTGRLLSLMIYAFMYYLGWHQLKTLYTALIMFSYGWNKKGRLSYS